VKVRVLLVTLQQALRSLIISLLPITTLTLITWSFAGSQTGDTSDPLRASIWFWLASHLIPFQLKLAPSFTPVIFNNLPIAAIAIPLVALRGSFKRATLELNNERAARSFLTFWYGILATLAALTMQSDTVKPVIFLAPIYAGGLALLASINLKSDFFRKFRYFAYLSIVLIGIASLLISISLITHFAVAKSLTTIIEPGWVGGLVLSTLQILYLPNIVIAVISYFAGIGFLIGPGTLVSPLLVRLSGIPAIPILAALPAHSELIYISGASVIALIFILNTLKCTNIRMPVKSGLKNIWNSSWIFIPIALLLGYQSGGTFFSKTLEPFGAKWWSLVTILILGEIVAVTIFYLFPRGFFKLLNRKDV
jgi:Family of unknown function (DUF6350)